MGMAIAIAPQLEIEIDRVGITNFQYSITHI